jgi:cell division protein FtsW
MARRLKSDQVLFLATLLLVAVSVVMVYSASAVLAFNRFNQPYLFLIKQAMWAVLGIAVLHVVMKVDYRHYRHPAVIWTIVGIAAVGLIAVFFSPPVNGSHRWLGLGPMGVQPSEFAKLGAILFAAAVLERRMHRIDEPFYALAPIGALAVVFMTLIYLEPDWGTAIALLLILAAMIFTAGLGWRYVVGLALCTIPVALSLALGADYRRKRLLAFLYPREDPQSSGYHVIQSIIAVATGGLTGKGFMGSEQKLLFLPEPHTDFIYAVISEEFGLIGATAILICFSVIAWRGVRVALRAPDSFGALAAVGLTAMLAFQALVNISVVLGMMPTKGIPLPFVSAGGSSLLVSLVGMGILLNVSQHASATG